MSKTSELCPHGRLKTAYCEPCGINDELDFVESRPILPGPNEWLVAKYDTDVEFEKEWELLKLMRGRLKGLCVENVEDLGVENARLREENKRLINACESIAQTCKDMLDPTRRAGPVSKM